MSTGVFVASVLVQPLADMPHTPRFRLRSPSLRSNHLSAERTDGFWVVLEVLPNHHKIIHLLTKLPIPLRQVLRVFDEGGEFTVGVGVG